jgi:hypothetical protein
MWKLWNTSVTSQKEEAYAWWLHKSLKYLRHNHQTCPHKREIQFTYYKLPHYMYKIEFRDLWLLKFWFWIEDHNIQIKPIFITLPHLRLVMSLYAGKSIWCIKVFNADINLEYQYIAWCFNENILDQKLKPETDHETSHDCNINYLNNVSISSKNSNCNANICITQFVIQTVAKHGVRIEANQMWESL